MHNITVQRLSEADENVIRHTAATAMDVSVESVTFVGQEYMGSDVPISSATTVNSSHICAEIQTYANTLYFDFVKNSNASQLYHELVKKLNHAIDNGNFTATLAVNAELHNSTSFTLFLATSQSVKMSTSGYEIFVIQTNDDYLSDNEVIGFSFFGVMFSFFCIAMTLSICSVLEEKGF